MKASWWSVSALTLGLILGCASGDDVPPWKRPGLMGNVPPGFFDEALKDARGDNQRMSTDIPAGERSTEPRMPTPPD